MADRKGLAYGAMRYVVSRVGQHDEQGLSLDLANLLALRQAAAMTEESRPKVGATDARRAASTAYHKRRTASGMKKVTVWLSPEAQDAIELLKDVHGSKNKALNALIIQGLKESHASGGNARG